MKVLLRLFPREWRERYSDEVVELIERREWRLGDHIDLLGGALSVWVTRWSRNNEEDEMPRLLMLGLVLVVIGAAATGWAVGELQDGVMEIPSHWWSSAAAAPLVSGLLLTGLSLRKRAHTADRSDLHA